MQFCFGAALVDRNFSIYHNNNLTITTSLREAIRKIRDFLGIANVRILQIHQNIDITNEGGLFFTLVNNHVPLF